MKKLISRMFRKAPPPAPPPPVVAPTPVAPPPPAVDPAEAARLVAQIEQGAVEAQELSRLAVEGPTSRVRLAAATAVVEPDQLHALLPRLRGKDKSVYKHVKQKCDALLAAQRNAEEVARESAALCEAFEKHSARAYEPLYAATLAGFSARWAALPDELEPQVRQRGQQALERCNEIVAAHQREVAAEAARQAAELASRQAARDAALAAAEQAAREATERAEQAAVAAAVEPDVATSETETEIDAEADAAAQARAERHAAQAHAQREVGSLIRLCSAALQRGDSRKAARFRAGLEQAMQVAPHLPPYLARSLQQLDEKLNELRQWKDYVVAPKRIELIEEMEALIGSDEPPEALAEHIRSLQQEWRTINKGLASDTTAESERFQQAYQAAFKPCQAHFTAQAAMRREHLEARKQVVERVQTFEARLQTEQADQTGQPDYPFILQVLREAPGEFRSHGPVDRDAGRAIEIEFNRSLDRLRAILNAWYERNVADKQALIAQAKHLSTIEDTTQAIEGVKRLQGLWKASGPVARDQHQALWEEFRGLCDTVYAKREQAYAQYSATLEAAKTQAVALCEQVEQANNDAAGEKAAAHARVREWQTAFDEIGELPRNEARGLRDRFEKAVAKFEAALEQQDKRDAAAGETNVFEAARHIRAYERAVIDAAAETDREALRAAAEAFLAGAHRWPKGALQALKQSLLRAGTADGSRVRTHEEALRILCIRAEILSSTPTPAADESLRRDYEMRLLMDGLGQARQADERDWDAMRLEWIAIGAVAADVHDQLEHRFRTCLAKRPAQDPQEARFKNHDGRDRESRRDRDFGDRKPRSDGRDDARGAGRGRPDAGGRR